MVHRFVIKSVHILVMSVMDNSVSGTVLTGGKMNKFSLQSFINYGYSDRKKHHKLRWVYQLRSLMKISFNFTILSPRWIKIIEGKIILNKSAPAFVQIHFIFRDFSFIPYARLQ